MNSTCRSIAQLRKEAEAIIKENPDSSHVLKTANVQKLLYELQVYQTELEIQNEDLRALAARNEAILQNMSDGLVIADISGKITDMNPAALAMFGFGSKEDMVRVMSDDAKVLDITDPDAKELSIGQWPLTRACTGERFTGQEYSVYVRPTKRRWYAEFSGAPVFDKDGAIEYTVLTIRDITEKKQAEFTAKTACDLVEHKMNEALEMQNRLFAVMQALPVGVALLDAQGGTVSANQTFDAIWGNPRPAAKTIGDYIQDKASWVDTGKVILPDEWASSRALRTGETVTGQIIRIQGFDGVQRVVINSAAPILDARREVAGCAVAVQDITRQIEDEKTIRESEAKLRAIFETSADAIGVSKAGIHIAANPGYLTLFGYSDDDDLVGKPITDLIAVSQRPAIIENVRKRARGESAPTGYETRGLRKDGTEFDMDVRVSTYTLGGEIFSVVIMRDITERKLAEKALRDSEDRFKAIAETTPVGIGVVGLPEAVFLYVNPAYVKSFGCTESEILGQGTPQIYWSPEDRDRILDVLKKQGYVAEYEVKLKRKDGTPFWGLSSVRPITYGGKPALLGAFVDITDRKKTEEELSRHLEELRATNAELARFNRVAVDRELRMVDLKKQVNELCAKLGQGPRYKVEESGKKEV
jgi:PAS domain S-box-containing protein